MEGFGSRSLRVSCTADFLTMRARATIHNGTKRKTPTMARCNAMLSLYTAVLLALASRGVGIADSSALPGFPGCKWDGTVGRAEQRANATLHKRVAFELGGGTIRLHCEGLWHLSNHCELVIRALVWSAAEALVNGCCSGRVLDEELKP